MKKITSNFIRVFTLIFVFALSIVLFSCDESVSGTVDSVYLSGMDREALGDTGGSTSGQGNGSGKITAGEWNDLDNWNFWNDLLNENDFNKNLDYWEFYTNNRISVLVTLNNTPLINAKLELKLNDEPIWKSMTDNFGKAELWIGLNKKENIENLNNYKLFINDEEKTNSLKLIEDGVVEINLNSAVSNVIEKVELAFIVDATGSMGDELEFLKDDLNNVIERAKQNNSNLDFFTGTVFYRDVFDQYIVKHSDFTSEIDATIGFINEQSAGGGGDYPEAVHTALNEAIHELQWSENAKTRIAFLLLDAPPHYEPQIIDNLHSLIAESAEKGIKIIPITASGIDKETEMLMRFFSIATNGTYVFITNDSGIGGDHIEASVGEYQVESLNDLLVRLIDKYSSSVN
jgi:hypothetical protein